MDQPIVVVGGGIVGIFSSIYLKRFFKEVVLIEKEQQLGGLLTSYEDAKGVFYDFGTHIPCQTYIPEIDEIIFKHIDETDWEVFEKLKVGNFFNGEYNPQTGFPNLLTLPKSVYAHGLIDFLNAGHSNNLNENLNEYLNEVYGPTFSSEVYQPILNKLLKQPLERLHTKAFKIFDVRRLVVGDVNLTNELKKSDIYDSKCAYPSYDIGVSSNFKYYPKNNVGVKKWIDTLERTAIEHGVTIKKGVAIEKIIFEDSNITEICLDNGKVLPTKQLIWTIPNQYLLKVVKKDTSVTALPEFRQMRLFNFNFDKNFKVKEHYVYCWDANLYSYRITLYPNLTNSLIEKGIANCTVEVLADKSTHLTTEQILSELELIGIIDSSYNVLSSDERIIEKGFPIITPQYIKFSKESYEILSANVKNLVLLGKGKGEAFFMLDSLKEAYEVLCNQNES